MGGAAHDDVQVRLARLEGLIEEREKRYDVALTAQKELVAALFFASDKAITKAEEAQRDYNHRSNEFRGQLDDQAKLLMPRHEAVGLLHALEDKLHTANADREKKFDGLVKEIAWLREHRMADVGMQTGNRRLRDDSKAWIAIGIAVLSTVITVVTILLKVGAATAQVPALPAPPAAILSVSPH